MKKILLTLLNFFIVFVSSLKPAFAHAGHPIIGGNAASCPTAGGEHIFTGIGCIHTAPDWLASGLLDAAIKMGGGVAFIFLLIGAFHLITSGGEPEHIEHAKEQITAAIAGLLLIVFSVVILRVVGIDILGIPGFERGTDSIKTP